MPRVGEFAQSRRGRTRLVGTLALAALAALTAACLPVEQGGPPPPPPPPNQYCHPSTPTNAAGYQAAFDGLRAANAGLFVAADGGIPVRLNDGRIIWMFGDTVLGRWQRGGPVDPFWGLDSNTFVVQNERCFTPYREPIADPAANQWVWPTGAVVKNNDLQVIGMHMRKTGSGPLDFRLVDVVVTTCSLSTLKCQGRVSLPPPNSPDYGLTVFSDESHVYAYGRIQQGRFGGFHHYVARVPVVESLLDSTKWEYWHDFDDPNAVPPNPVADGVGEFLKDVPGTSPKENADPMWFDPPDPPGGDPDNFLPGPDKGPGAGFPVTANGTGYLGSALGIDFIANADLFTYHDTNSDDGAAGPWIQDVTRAVDVPPNWSGMHTYGGRVVLELPNGPIALWSRNHDSFDAVLANPNLYRVQFATPNGNSLDPEPPPVGP